MRRLLLVLFVLAVLTAVGGWLLLHSERDQSTRVDSTDAAKLVGADDDAPDIDPGLRPEPGTYVYAGSGREHLDLLGGDTHEFPDEVSAVVELDPDDECAWTLNLVLIEEHVEARSYCTAADGIRGAAFSRTTTFLGREQTSSYECDDDAWHLAADARRASWTCTERRGGVVRYEATKVGDERITIGDDEIEATHLRVIGRQRGSSTGNGTSDWWLLDSGLPARITMDRSLTTTAGPLGKMSTTERYDYRLTTLEPRELD